MNPKTLLLLFVCALFGLCKSAVGGLVFEDDFAGTSIDAWWTYDYRPGGTVTQYGVLNFSRPTISPVSATQPAYHGRHHNDGLGSVSNVVYVGFEISNYTLNSGSGSPWFRIAAGNVYYVGDDTAVNRNISANGQYQIFLNNSSGTLAYSHPTNGISGTLNSQRWVLYKDGLQNASGAVSGRNVTADETISSLGWGIWNGTATTADVSMEIDNFEVYDTLEVTPPPPPAPPEYWAAADLHADFDTGDYRDLNLYSGGSMNNFWSSQSQYSEDTAGSQLVQTIDSSAGNYKSGNSVSGSYSPNFSFFDQTLTLNVRGISFDGTTGTGADLADTQMQQIYSFMGDGTVPSTVSDSIYAEVRGDGRVRLKARIDGSWLDAGDGNAFAEVTVANITGFDLTLEPGGIGTDYALTIFGDTTNQVSGNVSGLVKTAWGAGDGGTKLGLWAQELDGIKPGAGESIMVSTVGAYTITTLTNPNVDVTLLDQVGHKYRRTFFGANCLQMLNSAPYTLPGFIDLYEGAQKPFFRFPGGTPANFFNYETGFVDYSSEDSSSRRETLETYNSSISNKWGTSGMPIDDFFEFTDLTGADYSLTVNMTSFAPTNNRSYMQAIQALGATPKYIELGNELYFGTYDNYIENGATYAAEAEAHATAMREVFPDAKYGAVVPSQLYTDESFVSIPGATNLDRHENWYSQISSNQSFYDAIIIHLYSKVGMDNNTPTADFIPYEDAYRNCISHADSELEGVMDTLGTDFPGKDIWVTEFHVGGFGGNVRNYRLRYSYLGAMYANYFFFKLLNEPQVTVTHWHSFTHFFDSPPTFPSTNTVLNTRVTYQVFKTLGEYVERHSYVSPVDLSHMGTYEGSNGYNGTFDDLFACYLHSHTNGTLVLMNKFDNEYNLNSLSITNILGDVTLTGAKQVRPDDGLALTDALNDEGALTIQTYGAGEVSGLMLPPYSVTYVEIDQDWEIAGISEELFVIEHSLFDDENGDVDIEYVADDGYGYYVEQSSNLEAWTRIDASYYESITSGLHTHTVTMPASTVPHMFYRVVREEL